MADSEDSEKLCSVCGLCCSGIVVDIVALSADDPVEMFQHRTASVKYNGKSRLFFSLPCPYHSGYHCKIYDTPPKTCIKWKCKILLNFESGNMDYNGSVSKVNAVKDLASKIDSFLKQHGQQCTDLSWRKRVAILYRAKYPDSSPSDFRQDHTEFLLNVSALDVYSRKYFIPDTMKKEDICQSVKF